MPRRVYINRVNIYRSYHAYLLDGNYGALLSYPMVKNVVSNDWFEEDGLEVDMDGATFAERSITLKFGISGDDNWRDFVSFLNQSREHTLTISKLDVNNLKLCFCGATAFSCNADNNLAIVTVQYKDVKLSMFDYVDEDGEAIEYEPSVTAYRPDGFSIDDVNLGEFGLKILNGVEGMKTPSVPKAALERAIASRFGATYDVDAPIVVSGRSIALRGLFRASSLAEFWNNYHALLQAMTGKVIELNDDDSGATFSAVFGGGDFTNVSVGDTGDVWAIVRLQFMLIS